MVFINYDELIEKSYFNDKNINGRYFPITINDNMIPCASISELHYQTSFFLNLYSSLYIELKKYEKEINYNIDIFTNIIDNLKIIISDNNNTGKLSDFNSNIFTFYFKTMNRSTTTPSNLYNTTTYSGYDENILNISKPLFSTTPTSLIVSTDYILSINDIINKRINKTYIKKFRTSKLQQILSEILNQKPENIIGYILYQKIFYNIILYNIDIQLAIRSNYINTNPTVVDQQLNIKITQNYVSDNNFSNNINNITSLIDNYIILLKTISDNTFSNNNYLIEKNNYKNKINLFNNLREEYAKTNDKLNMSIKLYNQELINYNKIKNYATYIIILLIIIIVFTIILSIFPLFTTKTKNALYIIIFIFLLIITYLYYINFKYIILYEKFVNIDNVSCPTLLELPNTFIAKKNNADFFNKILPTINKYSNAVSDLFNDLRMNIYTIGSKSFSQDSNIIIYNIYVEKKRLIEINNIKLTKLFNMIEIIKKQINYLFNFVFIICCLCLILLLGLVLYSTIPQLYVLIIIICVVLITILMIYFAFAIIQPTRMIANKNYWAISNPSNNTMGKL